MHHFRYSGMKTKLTFYFAFRSPCTTLQRTAKIGGGSEKKIKLTFYFAFHSPCTIFVNKFQKLCL